MASKRIDELTTRTVVNTDLLPPTPSGGPSGSATVAAVVRAGLQQPNSASAGAGADITILAADGVTSGAGGNIILEPGAQATTGGNGTVIIRQPNGTAGTNEAALKYSSNTFTITNNATSGIIQAEVSNGNDGGYFEIRRKDVTYRKLYVYPSVSVGGAIGGMIEWTSGGGDSGGLAIGTAGVTPLRLIASRVTIGTGYSSQDVGLTRSAKNILTIDDASTGGGSLAYTSSTPSAIATNQNNYVLTGSAFQRLNCTSASDITGIAPPSGGSHVDGRMIRVVSVGSATITLKYNSTSSTAANRIYSSTGADIALATNQWADLIYDATDNGSGAAGWRAK